MTSGQRTSTNDVPPDASRQPSTPTQPGAPKRLEVPSTPTEPDAPRPSTRLDPSTTSASFDGPARPGTPTLFASLGAPDADVQLATTRGLTSARVRDAGELGALVSNNYAAARVTSKLGVGFRAHHLSRKVGGVFLSEVRANRHEVDRTANMVAPDDRQLVKFCFQLGGIATITQNNNVAELHPGDFTVEELAAPYAMSLDDNFRALFLLIEPDMLNLGAKQLRELSAMAVSGEQGLAEIVSPLLRNIATHLDMVQGFAGVRLVNSAVDLVGTVLHSLLGTQLENPAAERRRQMRESVHAYIDDHLGEAKLSPGQVAAAHFVSLRYLQGLFEEDGDTITAWIRQRRLEHARRDLADPRYTRLPLLDIATRWGITDASHFSRLFKARYGMTPSDYRAAHSEAGLRGIG